MSFPPFQMPQASLQITIADTILFLDTLADRLDGWAIQSQKGGWSTHQVDANIAAADECRRTAARLCIAIKERD